MSGGDCFLLNSDLAHDSTYSTQGRVTEVHASSSTQITCAQNHPPKKPQFPLQLLRLVEHWFTLVRFILELPSDTICLHFALSQKQGIGQEFFFFSFSLTAAPMYSPRLGVKWKL